MRIIIKPLGATLLIMSTACLGMLALRNTSQTLLNSSLQKGAALEAKSILTPADTWAWSGQEVAGTSVKSVLVQGQPFPNALRMMTSKATTNPWDAQVTMDVTAPVEKEDVLLVSFYGRVISGPGKVDIVVERNSGSYDKMLEQGVPLTKDWKRYQFAFKSPASLKTGTYNSHIRLGYAAQTVEIGDIKVFNYQKKIKLNELEKRAAAN